MFFRLLLLLILIPFAEIALLLELADQWGWRVILLLLVASTVLGIALSRRQGFVVWSSIQQQLREGQPPTTSLIEAGLVYFAGIALMIPGFLSDIVGFLLLWPALRKKVALQIVNRMSKRATVHTQHGYTERGYTVFHYSNITPPPEQEPPRFDANGQEIIDVEFTRKNDQLPEN